MLVVAAFIEQVVLEVNKKEVRVEALTLKHCGFIHKASQKAHAVALQHYRYRQRG